MTRPILMPYSDFLSGRLMSDYEVTLVNDNSTYVHSIELYWR